MAGDVQNIISMWDLAKNTYVCDTVVFQQSPVHLTLYLKDSAWHVHITKTHSIYSVIAACVVYRLR